VTLDEPDVQVIVADAHSPFRKGVRTHLGAPFTVVGEAGSVSELARLATTTDAALLLLDQMLPGGGLAAALEVAPPRAQVVVFAQEPHDEQVVEAVRLGVAGYLRKDIDGRRLGATLRAVVAGRPALDPSLVGALFEEIARRERTDRHLLHGGGRVLLTRRESDVALRLREGRSTSAIAADLGIADVTVRRHVSELMRKLRVESRAAAIELLRA
jgi:two-component system nitrate/nitrite response regulator NarL